MPTKTTRKTPARKSNVARPKSKSALNAKFTFSRSQLAIVIGLVLVIGGIIVWRVLAATSQTEVETWPASGGNTKTVADNTASGGSYLEFLAPTASTTVTPGTTTPLPAGQLRTYPLHTNINATTYWVGELFQNTPDGSQVCSAYNSNWLYSFFRLAQVNNCKAPTSGYVSGCDAVLKNTAGKCDDVNSIASLRTPANGYFPPGLQAIYENPFYIDLPYDDYNPTDATDITGYATRCADIPWAKRC
jgi:hypothetical protein